MNPARPLLLFPLLMVAGCTAGPDYRSPSIAVPSTFSSGADRAGPAPEVASWWTAYGDPVLDGLVARGLAANLDIRQAASRVEQARLQERVVRAEAGPQINASGQAGYSKLSQNSLPSALTSLGTLGSGSPSTGTGIGLPGEGFSTFQLGFDASWELDLFGGQRRAREAAAARTEAALWSRRDAEVMLAAEIATHYQQYRALQRRIAIADEALAAGREMIALAQARSANGLATTIDMRQQERALEEQAAQRADLAALAAARVHALGTLLGLAPAALELSPPPPEVPAMIDVPPGLPSELLQRRPDIRAAERRLAAASADIGVAKADLYPKFSLTGALQLASRALTSLVDSDSILANGAGRLSVPLLGGTGRANVALREEQANETLIAYRASVLAALRDVEDALTRLDADRKRAASLRAAAAAAGDALDTRAVRYRNGLIALSEVIEARRSWLGARDALAQAEAAAAQDAAALYKALGGGWDARRAESEEGDDRGRAN
jgi:multidrug efflux system outer membrane protein